MKKPYFNVEGIHKSWWEQDIECNFCKTSESERKIIIENACNRRHNLVECSRCGLRFFDPRLKEDWLLKSKANTDQEMYAVRCFKFGTMMPHGEEPGFDVLKQKQYLSSYYTKVYAQMQEVGHVDYPRILDVGCGVSWALKQFCDLGASPFSKGIDPSFTSIKFSKMLVNLEFIQSSFARCNEPELGMFDFIHANDVIEHTYTPYDDLCKMRRLTYYGGVLFLKTFAEDLDEKYGRTMLAPPGHSHHITQEVMERMLSASGWKVMDWSINAKVQMTIVAKAV